MVSKHQLRLVVSAALLATLAMGLPSPAQDKGSALGAGKLGPRPGVAVATFSKLDQNPSLTSVRASFDAIRTAGAPMGFGSGPLPFNGGIYDFRVQNVSATSGSHWEGMGRLYGSPYLVMSANQAGELMLVQMGSRAVGPARWGSNRPTKGPPPANDAIVAINGQPTFRLGRPNYTHLGGLSVIGNYVAVGLEREGDSGTDGFIHLVDFTNATTPRLVWNFHHPQSSAGTVAVTKRADGHFLLAVGGWGSATVDFYLSTGTNLETTQWTSVRHWTRSECVNAVPGDSTCFASHQNLTFVSQTDGRLFLLGTNRNSSDEDWIDLLEVTNLPPAGATSAPAIRITKVAKKHVFCNDGCNFKAAAGVFVNAGTQELYVYSTEWRRSTASRFGNVGATDLWTRFNEL